MISLRQAESLKWKSQPYFKEWAFQISFCDEPKSQLCGKLFLVSVGNVAGLKESSHAIACKVQKFFVSFLTN